MFVRRVDVALLDTSSNATPRLSTPRGRIVGNYASDSSTFPSARSIFSTRTSIGSPSR
jgi:hypothetical protein